MPTGRSIIELKQIKSLFTRTDIDFNEHKQKNERSIPKNIPKVSTTLQKVWEEFLQGKEKLSDDQAKKDFVIKFCKKYKTLSSSREHAVRNIAFELFFKNYQTVDTFLEAKTPEDLYLCLGIPSRYARACEKNISLTVREFLSCPKLYFPEKHVSELAQKNVINF